MPITFDKTGFRKTARWIKLGKKKYSFRITLWGTLFQAVFTSYFLTLIIEENFSWQKFLILFLVLFILNFIVNYFIMLRQWKSFVANYNETLEYWEKHDPSFFEGVKYEKIEEVVPDLSKSENL